MFKYKKFFLVTSNKNVTVTFNKVVWIKSHFMELSQLNLALC